MISETPKDHKFWRLVIHLPKPCAEATVDLAAEILQDLAVSVSTLDFDKNDDVRIEAILDQELKADDIILRFAILAKQLDIAQFEDIKDITIEELPDENWLERSYQQFPPITIGNFFIYGSHHKEELPSDRIAIEINAATAFGSGDHPTTSGCLQAMEKLSQNHDFQNILDMGCGSGILSIAAAKLWPDAKITAVDIDAEAIDVTDTYTEINKCAGQIHAFAGDGFKDPKVSQNGPYDLIIANILANPLISMAEDLSKSLKEPGYCVLSGLLTTQKTDIESAYQKHELSPYQEIFIEDWACLVFKT